MKISLIFLVLLIIIPSIALAEDLKYFPGTTYYNDPFEFQVNPGDTIYLGRIYDLRNVMGTNHTLALWYDWRYGGSNCFPDAVFPVGYIETNGQINPKAVYLDPLKGWRVGDYYAWSGCYYTYNFKTGEKTLKTYSHEYNFMFTVINPPERKAKPTPGEIANLSVDIRPGMNVNQSATNQAISVWNDQDPGMPPFEIINLAEPTINKQQENNEIISVWNDQDPEMPQVEIINISKSVNNDEIIIITPDQNVPAQPKEEPVPWYIYLIVIIVIGIVVIIFLFG